MKTTIEISDTVYRQVKARASLRGITMKAFFLEAPSNGRHFIE